MKLVKSVVASALAVVMLGAGAFASAQAQDKNWYEYPTTKEVVTEVQRSAASDYQIEILTLDEYKELLPLMELYNELQVAVGDITPEKAAELKTLYKDILHELDMDRGFVKAIYNEKDDSLFLQFQSKFDTKSVLKDHNDIFFSLV